MDILITWLLTAINLLIIVRLSIGIEVDNFLKVLVAAIVFGILNV